MLDTNVQEIHCVKSPTVGYFATIRVWSLHIQFIFLESSLLVVKVFWGGCLRDIYRELLCISFKLS